MRGECDETVSTRLESLAEHGLLGEGVEAELQELVELGASSLGVPICAITLLEASTQRHKAQVGLNISSLPIEVAFCRHTILSDRPFVILDTFRDRRFQDNPLVTEHPGIRFYAGVPITTAEGVRLGAFCVIDTEPHDQFTAYQFTLLKELGKLTSRRIQRRLVERPAKVLSGFAEASALGIVTTDSGGKITSWNAAASRIFGHDQCNVLGRDLDLIIPERFCAAHNKGLKLAAANGQSSLAGRLIEVTAVHAQGHEFPIELSIATWQDGNGTFFGAYIQDISARKARESDLHDLAHKDPLTGLMNAKAFRECLEVQIRSKCSAMVLVLDLDGFKAINDSLGHAFGDALLQTLAIRLRKLGGDAWQIARLGGDEFAVLLDVSDPFAARDVAVTIVKGLSEAVLIDGYRVNLAASVGISLAPDHAVEAEELLVRADLAMFRAKKEGGRTYRIFDQAMNDELNSRRQFRNELRNASGARQWELYYQPQYNLQDGSLTGVEALLRWRHPVWGVILPAAFMPILETHVLAYEVGNWVLEEACRQLAHWRKRGVEIPRVSVNLFSAQIHTGSITERVRSALEKNGLCTSDLELEITETIALRHNDASLAPLFDLIRAFSGR